MQWRAGHKGFSIAAGTIESSKPHQMIVYLHSTLPHTTAHHSTPQYTTVYYSYITVYYSILQLYHSIPQYIQASLQLQENNVRRSYCTQTNLWPPMDLLKLERWLWLGCTWSVAGLYQTTPDVDLPTDSPTCFYSV